MLILPISLIYFTAVRPEHLFHRNLRHHLVTELWKVGSTPGAIENFLRHSLAHLGSSQVEAIAAMLSFHLCRVQVLMEGDISD